MASDERLNSIAAEKPAQELTELIALTKELTDGIIGLNRVSKGLEINLKGAGTLKDVVTVSGQLVDANGQLVQAYGAANGKFKEAIDLMKVQNGHSKETVQVQQEIIKLKLLEERATAQSAKTSKEASAEKKRMAAEERELNRLIAIEEKALAAQSKAEARAVADARKQADKEYQDTWRALLNERDAKEREAAIQRKKEAAEAVARVAIDSNVALSRTLNDLRGGYDRLTRAERENAEIGGVLRDRITDLDTQLRATDAATGRFQRNVGNYSSATAGFRFQITQVARELPSLANGLSVFASAIGNNVPMAIDAMERLRTENAALRAEGQRTTPIWKTLAGAIFNWQTAIIVLLTVLPALAKAVTAGGKAAQEAEKANKKYKESLNSIEESSRANAQQEIARMKVLASTAANTALSTDTRRKAVLELQKTFPDYFANLTREQILNGNVKDAIDLTTQALLRQAKVQAAQKKFAAASEQVYDLTELQAQAQEKVNKATERANELSKQALANSSNSRVQNAATRAAADVVAAQKDLDKVSEKIKKAEAEQQKFLKDTLTPIGDIGGPPSGSVAALRQKIADLKAVIELQKVGSAEQIASTKELIELEKQLKAIEGHQAKGAKAHDTTNDELKAETDLTAALYEQWRQRSANSAAIQKAIADDETNNLQKRSDAYANYFNERLNEAGLESAKEQTIIRQKLDKIAEIEAKAPAKRTNEEKKLLLSKEALEVQLVTATEKYEGVRTGIIEENVKYQEKLIKEYGKDGEDAIKQSIKNLNSLGKYFEGNTSQTDSEDKRDKRRQKAELEVNEGIQFAHSIADVNSSLAQRRIDEIDAEIAKINERRDAEIAAIEKSGLSAAQKEQKIADVKAQADAKTKALEADAHKRARRAAEFDKAVTVAQIIATTALAAIKQAAATPLPAGAFAIGAIIALGAAQLAAAVAAPLPAYADGSEGEYVTGKAVTDERGAEGYMEQSGKFYLGSDKGANIKDFKVPTKIISREDMMNLSRIDNINIGRLAAQIGIGVDLSSLESKMDSVKKAIESKPVAQFNVTGMGMQHLTKSANQITEYIKNFSA